MYGKLFSQMYDGTLGTKGPWQALVTFQQLIILADKHGEVDMTAEAIARRTTVPLEIIQGGIAELCKPDPESRSPDEDGRRLVPISPGRDWGWRIVNYGHYRKIRSEEERREYHKLYMRNYRDPVNQIVNMSTGDDQCQPIAVSNKQYAVSKDQEHVVANATTDRVPYSKIVELYHEILPELPKVLKITAARKAHIAQRWREDMDDLEDWKLFFTEYVKPSKHLMGKNEPSRGYTKPFLASLDWLIKPANYAKVIERHYRG